MSNWSSFEKEKAYTDRWRLFLEQEEAQRNEQQFDHGDYAFVYTEIRNFKGQTIQPDRAEQVVRALFAKKDQIGTSFGLIMNNINSILDDPINLDSTATGIKKQIAQFSRSNPKATRPPQNNNPFSAVVLQACFFVGLDKDEEILKHIRHMQEEQGTNTTTTAGDSAEADNRSAKQMIRTTRTILGGDPTDAPSPAGLEEGFKDFINKAKDFTTNITTNLPIISDLIGNKKYSEADKAKINKDFMLKARTLIAIYITNKILN